MNQELREILNGFVQSGWALIADPAAAYLAKEGSRESLIEAVAQAQRECGDCGCPLDPLYPRALELLRQERRVVYGKLVRNRIPEIIAGEGFVPETRVLDQDAYLEELNRKLTEETAEYLQSGELEELADILEVVEALCKAKGFSIEELSRIKAEKQAARGAFDDRIYLIAKE